MSNAGAGAQNIQQIMQQLQSQQRYHTLIRPEHVPSLPHIDETQKQKYTQAIRQMWQMLATNAPDTDAHRNFYTKLSEVTQKVKAGMEQWKEQRRHAQQQQQQQQQQGQQGQQGQQAQAQASDQAKQQGGGQGQQQQQQGGMAQGQQQRPSQQVMNHVQQIKYYLPPDKPSEGPEAEKALRELKQSYLLQLMKQEQTVAQIKKMRELEEHWRSSGQEAPSNYAEQKSQVQKVYEQTCKALENFKQRQVQFKAFHEQAQQQAAGASQQPTQVKIEGSSDGGAQPQPQTSAPAPSQQGQQQPPQQGVHASVEAARNNALGANRASQSPATVGQPPGGQFLQNSPQGQPGSQGQTQAQQAGSPHGQTQPSNPNGAPVPLSHQAAVSAAQRNYVDARNQQSAASHPSSSQPPSFSTAALNAQGASQQNSASQAQQQQQQSQQHQQPQINMEKMRVSKNLSVPPLQAVSVGASRPSLAAPNSGPSGALGQPVVTRPPQAGPLLEGESGHLLSKNKLYELVRQVTGDEGPDDELLSPEVEEMMLNFADDFVDDLATQAARLAKLGDQSQLDIRHVQLILERNFNIRIPGYATDEVRTVRKFNPAPGWTQKMNAVQAAKVMGGKTDI